MKALRTPVWLWLARFGRMERFHNLNAFLEHAGLIGGFVIIAVLALREPAAAQNA